MNDLAVSLRRLIALTGPISLQQFMGQANARYYDSRDPLGVAQDSASGGDFVTAPEISQMFGELVGLWLTDIWDRAGRPGPVLYVELGPGRGTLARDALRVMARQGVRPQVHLVEGSRSLRAVQRGTIPNATWHNDLATVPEGAPMLLVANEFFDALPIRQLVRTPRGWRERMVGLEGDRLAFVAGGMPMDAAVPAERGDARPGTFPEGTIIETCPGAAAVMGELAARLVAQRGAALVIDYGHLAPRTGSTLQAVRDHARADPFATPGEADLTAHVDFAALRDTARARGARVLGITTQGAWLRALGIDARAEALISGALASGAQATGVQAAGVLAGEAQARAGVVRSERDRLVDDAQMGTLFKVLALASPAWPDGAGL